MIRNAFSGGANVASDTDNGSEDVASDDILGAADDEATSEDSADSQPEGDIEEPTPDDEEHLEEDEAEDSEENEEDADPEEEEFFYEGPTSKYRTAEDARQGIVEKDRYIEQLRNENESLLLAQAELEQLRTLVSEDAMEQRAVNERLPEEYRDKNVDDFETQEEKLEYVKALARAEAEYAAEKGQREVQAKQRQEELRKKADAANEFLTESVSYESFEASNPEDRNALARFLDEKVAGDTTRLAAAQEVHLAFGPELATAFVEGLKVEFAKSRGRAIGKIVEKVKTRPVRTATKGKPNQPKKEEAKKADPSEMIKGAYGRNAKQNTLPRSGRRRR